MYWLSIDSWQLEVRSRVAKDSTSNVVNRLACLRHAACGMQQIA